MFGDNVLLSNVYVVLFLHALQPLPALPREMCCNNQVLLGVLLCYLCLVLRVFVCSCYWPDLTPRVARTAWDSGQPMSADFTTVWYLYTIFAWLQKQIVGWNLHFQCKHLLYVLWLLPEIYFFRMFFPASPYCIMIRMMKKSIDKMRTGKVL